MNPPLADPPLGRLRPPDLGRAQGGLGGQWPERGEAGAGNAGPPGTRTPAEPVGAVGCLGGGRVIGRPPGKAGGGRFLALAIGRRRSRLCAMLGLSS